MSDKVKGKPLDAINDLKKENEQFLSHYSNISSENNWRLISYEMTKMKMYLKLIPDPYTKKIIEMQKIYKDTLKQIVKIKLWENSISSSNTQKEASLGQFEDIKAALGEYLEAGDVVGTIGEPSRFYTKEGTNLYFAIEKDGNPVDPMLLIQ